VFDFAKIVGTGPLGMTTIQLNRPQCAGAAAGLQSRRRRGTVAP
jgi:hypothetical protein